MFIQIAFFKYSYKSRKPYLLPSIADFKSLKSNLQIVRFFLISSSSLTQPARAFSIRSGVGLSHHAGRFITGNITTLFFAALGFPHKSNTNNTTLVCQPIVSLQASSSQPTPPRWFAIYSVCSDGSSQMEAQNSLQEHIIEVKGDIPAGEQSLGGSKICAGAVCGFSDSGATSKDAKERSASMRKLLIAVVLCVIFMAVEVVGGIKANSLAILTDAAHLLSDVAGFAISLFSLWAAGWEATPQQSYGFFRIEILGALVSIQLIWLLTGIIVYEAIARLIYETAEVQGFLMFAVAAFGLVVNVIMAVLLGHDHGHHGHSHGGHDHSHGGHDHGHDHEDHGHKHGHGHSHSHGISVTAHHHQITHSKHDEHFHAGEANHTEPFLGSCEDLDKSKATHKEKKQRNINVQGAYLHVLGDTIQSIGVMIGGAVIWYKPEWKIIDLICTLIFSVIVLATTIRMLRNVLEVLMESTPREIDATKLQKGLCEIPEVVAIHELHIWAITVGKVLLACHVLIKPDADADMVLDKVVDYIKREYNISHVTIQIERQ